MLLCQRQDRAKEEKSNQARLLSEVHNLLMNNNGRRLSPDRFGTMLNDTLYNTTGDEEYLEARPSDVAKARAYLKARGIDSSLMDDDWQEASVSQKNMKQSLDPKQPFSQPRVGALDEALGQPPSKAFALPSQKSHGPLKAWPATQNFLKDRKSPLRQTTTIDPTNITKASGASLVSEIVDLSHQTAGPLCDTSEVSNGSIRAPSRRASDVTNAELHRSLASFAQVQRNVSSSIPSPPEEPSLLTHAKNGPDKTANGESLFVDRARDSNKSQPDFNPQSAQHPPESAPSMPANKKKSSMNNNGQPPKTKSTARKEATPMVPTPAASTSPDAVQFSEKQPSRRISLGKKNARKGSE